ncbi:hypothetical protein MBLNU13_g10380t2 [Cladosporium sp. NU13]
MPSKVTPRTSYESKPHAQPPRYGLRGGNGRQTVFDGKVLKITGDHTTAKWTKRTPTDTRARPPPSRGSVKKGTILPVQGRAKRNKNKLWPAKAICGENDTQYLIEYEPVYQGAEPEISWQPKCFPNAALLRDWEKRKMTTARDQSNAEPDKDPNLTLRGNEVGQRSDLVEHGDQNLVASFPLQDQYAADLKGLEQHTNDIGDKRALAGFGNSSEDTSLTTTSTIIPEDSSIHTPESNAAAAEMYDDHKNRGLHDSSAVALYTLENGFAPSPRGLEILNHGLSKGDTVEGNSGKPTPRPGTSISTILSPAPRTLSDENKDDESSTFVGNHSSQALPGVSTGVKVPKNRDVQNGPSGTLASAREQLRLLLRGPGRRRYRKSHPRPPPSP